MPKQPNSDKSNRAQRRRAEREAAQQPAPQPVAQPGAGGIPIRGPDMLAKIGVLTMERDFWQTRAAQLEGQLQRLAEIQLPQEAPAEAEEEETPQENGESEEQPAE